MTLKETFKNELSAKLVSTFGIHKLSKDVTDCLSFGYIGKQRLKVIRQVFFIGFYWWFCF